MSMHIYCCHKGKHKEIYTNNMFYAKYDIIGLVRLIGALHELGPKCVSYSEFQAW